MASKKKKAAAQKSKSKSKAKPKAKPGYQPNVNTTRTYNIKEKGKITQRAIVQFAQTNWLGHRIFTLLGQQGINLSEHIDAKGKMTPFLKHFLKTFSKSLKNVKNGNKKKAK